MKARWFLRAHKVKLAVLLFAGFSFLPIIAQANTFSVTGSVTLRPGLNLLGLPVDPAVVPDSQTLLPRVHRVAALLKRWLLGIHQGAVSHEHLDAYLDEFTFRFNRRPSRHRGKLFYLLAQQAVTVRAVPYRVLVNP